MAEVRHPNAVKVLAALKKYVDEGYTEGGNNLTIFGQWFGLQGQPWCAMFVSWGFKEAGLSHLVAAQSAKGFASCNIGYKWFAKNDRIIPIGQAQPGDVVFFNFDSDPTTTEHVGIVYKNDGKNLITFEGNTSGTAKGSQSNGEGAYMKKRPYANIMAVARPDWDKPAPAPAPAPAFSKDVKQGDKGANVKAVQKALKLTADGDFGPGTKKAVEKFQADKKLPVTGVVDKATWTKLVK